VRVLTYLGLMAGEWAVVLLLARRFGPNRLREWIGGAWHSPGSVALDVGLGAALWLAWRLWSQALSRLPFLGAPAHVAGLLPRGPLEIALWIPLSITAGFAEELIFRGWLQGLLATRTGSRWLGLLLQGLLFGALHLYEGAAACVRIACFGLLFGVVALWRQSLRPGMIAHAATDIVSGLFWM
jgi:membrane protease YdiL (CAAX protease family)